ncbi:hypothetical protein [Kitasatospora cineracea]|uniref:hypothetical protein n=1 Tax=Kitasatospora cineracea TaxID=88074 RepID=UPI003806524B
MIDALNQLRLDGVILSELLPDQVAEVAAGLGMDPYESADTEVTKNRNYLFMRPGGCFRVTANHVHPYSRAPRIPPVNVSVALVGEDGADLPGVFALVGHHAAFHGWLWRLWEAEGLVPLIQDGRRVLLAADFNEEPTESTRMIDHIEDREHYHSRTRPDFANGGRVLATLADEALRAAGYVDLAVLLGIEEGLRPTAGYSTLGQGGDSHRNDRWMADRHTAASIERVVTVTGLEHLSDHRPVAILGDLALLHESTLSGYERMQERAGIKEDRKTQRRAAARSWTPPI